MKKGAQTVEVPIPSDYLIVQSGEYILGFQVKPEERLELTCKSIQALLNGFQSAPIFGVQYSRHQQVHITISTKKTIALE
jgi:hypothetical protein